MSLDISRLEKVRVRGEKTIARCPVCAARGLDNSAEHLFLGSGEGFRCIVGCDTKEIFALAGIKDGKPTAVPRIAPTPIPKPKRVNLLSRIKTDYPASFYGLWDSSPVLCDESSDDAKAFLALFPADAVLWVGKDIYQTGEPRHAVNFRPRSEWKAETFTAAGTRIAPSDFKPGSISRSFKSVAQHLFVVIESDEIGEGKLYANRDEFCCLLRWLREACFWKLAAVVDSGRRSLHAWFRHPGFAEVTQLAEHKEALGLDAKFLEPSQPWRLPGVFREGSDRRQQLVFLDPEAAL